MLLVVFRYGNRVKSASHLCLAMFGLYYDLKRTEGGRQRQKFDDDFDEDRFMSDEEEEEVREGMYVAADVVCSMIRKNPVLFS